MAERIKWDRLDNIDPIGRGDRGKSALRSKELPILVGKRIHVNQTFRAEWYADIPEGKDKWLKLLSTYKSNAKVVYLEKRDAGYQNVSFQSGAGTDH